MSAERPDPEEVLTGVLADMFEPWEPASPGTIAFAAMLGAKLDERGYAVLPVPGEQPAPSEATLLRDLIEHTASTLDFEIDGDTFPREVRKSLLDQLAVVDEKIAAAPSPDEQPAPSGIAELHTPVDEEAEVWADNDSTGSLHDERFPDCPGGDRCEGHAITMQVCSECGYAHDGEMPLYRPWPCPTVKLLVAAPSPDEDTRRDAEAIVWALRGVPTALGPDTRKRAAELLAAAYLKGDEHG